MTKFRYPGVKPFEKKDQKIFFGRDEDIDDLYNLIMLEKLVVLFGKSGYGKSSLLNAGILPRFLEGEDGIPNILPIIIRLGVFFSDKSISPLEKLSLRLKEEAPFNSAGDFLKDHPSLWAQFKRRYGKENGKFLLIFDQFEEFFTYPIEQQNQFKEELAQLLYTGIPQNIRDNLDNYQKEQRQYLSKKIDVKVLFAIRSDRISYLDGLKDRLPSILYKRYELKGLTYSQAKAAIINPALLQNNTDDEFNSPMFSFDSNAIEFIIGELTKGSSPNQESIEAFQLQILCQYIEGEVISGRIKKSNNSAFPIVSVKDLPNIANIYEAYYHTQLDKLSSTEREATHELIEYGLIYEDEQSGESRRLSMDADALIQRFSKDGASHKLLEKLENTFLLRREPNSLGRYNYEICHDTLIVPILKSKREREIEKKRLAEEKKAKEEEQKQRAIEETERRKEAERLQRVAERGRKRATAFSIISFFLFILFLMVTTIAFYQSKKLRLAMDNILVERAEKNELNFEVLSQRAIIILDAGGCPIEIVEEMEGIIRDTRQLSNVKKIHIRMEGRDTIWLSNLKKIQNRMDQLHCN
jgi:hypothetical protein